jgi:hypothetical protein
MGLGVAESRGRFNRTLDPELDHTVYNQWVGKGSWRSGPKKDGGGGGGA